MLTRDYRFAPTVGFWQVELVRTAREIARSPEHAVLAMDHEIDDFMAQVGTVGFNPSLDRLRYLFALSLLCDIYLAGGRIGVLDSVIHVSWPDWESDLGRDLARRALDSISSHRDLRFGEVSRLRPLFLPTTKRTEVIDIMRSGRFWLEPAHRTHASGVRYAEAFTAGLRLWRMPYRGREGRLRRFLIVGQSLAHATQPFVVGLIEVGDDAPYSTERDAFLVMRSQEMRSWLDRTHGPHQARAVGDLMRQLRHALLPIPGISPDLSAASVVELRDELLRRAQGRSQSEDALVEKKKIAYLVRLAMGEIAFDALGRGQPEDPAGIREGVRAVHDLTVPRVHMEVTVCGAVPPFTSALGGKLVTAFLGHPDILAITKGGAATIVRELFDLSRLEALLPHWGLLAMTTKGLYPGHSALYNRAEIPGESEPVRLQKVGNTKGSTTTLLGTRTGKLAHLLMDATPARTVSRTYGTGGAKRQRLIESAVMSTNLPGSFVHAGIRRPVYGLRLVSNLAECVWLGAQPSWNVKRLTSGDEYSRAATVLWRGRWLAKAEMRLAAADTDIPGALEHLVRPEP